MRKNGPRTERSKRILIYGDSNVWGDNFVGSRIRHSDRWVNRLARALRGKARIIADGVCGRVAGDFCADKPHKNGKSAFAAALQQAGTVDIVIIALGTNDLQQKYQRTSQHIIDDLLMYQKLAPKADIVYLLPPPFSTGEDSGPEFTAQSERVRQEILKNKDALGSSIQLPPLPLSDGIHFSPKGHRLLARLVKNMLEDRC